MEPSGLAVQYIPKKVFLPILTRSYVGYPDLVITDLAASPNGVQVTLTNEGDTAVTQGFWVDLYIAPETPPTAPNQIWQLIGSQGLVWGITQPLDPGESLVLTLDSPTYRADLSAATWPLAAGTAIWAQVDSAHTGTTYGGVLEDHEVRGEAYNNVSGPVTVSSTAKLSQQASRSAAGEKGTALPPRP